MGHAILNTEKLAIIQYGEGFREFDAALHFLLTDVDGSWVGRSACYDLVRIGGCDEVARAR